MTRPVIGLCAALERARWGLWDTQAVLLPREYPDAVQRAGGLALLLPPDPVLIQDPDEILERLDGLIVAGGSDVDPAAYGAEPHAATTGVVRERDRFELALTARALELDLPYLGICRGMQVLNVARGGTLLQHLPDSHGHEDHRRTPGSFDGADHDVRLRDGSLAARAAGETSHGDQVPPPPGRRPPRRGARGHRLGRPRRAPGGDRGPGAPLRARRPVAPGGGRDEPRHRLARGRSGGTSRRSRSRTGTGGGGIAAPNAAVTASR